MAEIRPEAAVAVVEDQGRWQALIHGRVIAETDRALTVIEDGRAAVRYFPLASLRAAQLTPTGRQAGRHGLALAEIYGLVCDGRAFEEVAWGVPAPPAALAALREHVAFDPLWVEVRRIDERAARRGVGDSAPNGRAERIDIAQPYRDTGSI